MSPLVRALVSDEGRHVGNTLNGILTSENRGSAVAGASTAAVFTEAMIQTNSAPTERSGRPAPGEYADYAQADIDKVNGDDAVAVLETLAEETLAFLRGLPEEKLAGVRYAPGKWTVKDLVAHVIDDERIFAYRRCAWRGERRNRFPGSMKKSTLRTRPAKNDRGWTFSRSTPSCVLRPSHSCDPCPCRPGRDAAP
jgi:hypothetical protein